MPMMLSLPFSTLSCSSSMVFTKFSSAFSLTVSNFAISSSATRLLPSSIATFWLTTASRSPSSTLVASFATSPVTASVVAYASRITLSTLPARVSSI